MSILLKYFIYSTPLIFALGEKITIRNRILEKAPYEEIQSDQRIFYRWLYYVSEVIFIYKERFILVINENQKEINTHSPKIINEFSRITLNLITDNYPLPNFDVNYAVISNDLNFFINVFDTNLHYKYAKYLIGTSMDEKNIDKLIEHLEEREYPFVTIVSIFNKIGRIYQYRGNKTIEDNYVQNLSVIFESKVLNNLTQEDFNKVVRPYLDTVCPVKRCYLRANNLKYETVLGKYTPKYTPKIFETTAPDLLRIYADTTSVKKIDYPFNSSESWGELEAELMDDNDGVDVIFGNLVGPANFSELFDIVCIYK